MPGFFSTNAPQTLTQWSNYYIDWSRVGGLLRQGTHRYSWNELMQRGIILASIGAGGYAGYNAANQNSAFMSGLYSMAGCFTGFVVSHLVVTAPLIYKRYQLSQECMEAQKVILNALQDLKDYLPNNENINQLIPVISTHVDTIMNMNLSKGERANASLTWGRRRTLLTNLAEKLKQDIIEVNNSNGDSLIDMKNFWSKDTALIAEDLKNYKPNQVDKNEIETPKFS
ncbi:hypothetical protein ACNVED_14140 [Legionella sp. D16C41]|uniref:hypothetical protein n=1 Tax=Legionella sp. D16C41 TaxID=3402688 RepID=UPI003AF9EE44